MKRRRRRRRRLSWFPPSAPLSRWSRRPRSHMHGPDDVVVAVREGRRNDSCIVCVCVCVCVCISSIIRSGLQRVCELAVCVCVVRRKSCCFQASLFGPRSSTDHSTALLFLPPRLQRERKRENGKCVRRKASMFHRPHHLELVCVLCRLLSSRQKECFSLLLSLSLSLLARDLS